MAGLPGLRLVRVLEGFRSEPAPSDRFCAREEAASMVRKRAQAKPSIPKWVTFDFQDRTYQIDPEQRKVYRRFVEIETSKASTILSVWRGQHVGA